MIHCYGYEDDVVQSYEALIEATVSHGKNVAIVAWEKLPEKSRQELIKQAKAQGYGEGYARYVLAPSYFTSDPNVQSDMMFTTPVSLSNDDIYMGAITYGIEKYDVEQDKQILLSENIVEAYNASINGRFEEAKAITDKLAIISNKMGSGEILSDADNSVISSFSDMSRFDINIVTKSLCVLIDLAAQWNLSEDDIKRLICDAFYQPSEDPEEIKKIVNARIQYNSMMIQLFRGMLEQNYRILGITKEEADLLLAQLDKGDSKTQQDAMVKIRTAVATKSREYMIGTKSFDLRPLGAGIYLETDEQTGLEQHFTPERVTQMVMQYDCMIMAHGKDSIESEKQFVGNYNRQFMSEKEKITTEMSNILGSPTDPQSYGKLRQNLEMLQQELTSQENEIAKSEQAMRANQEQIDSIQEAYDACSKTLAELQSADTASNQDEIKKLKQTTNNLKHTWDMLQNQQTKLKSEIEFMELSTRSYRDSISEIKRQLPTDEYQLKRMDELYERYKTLQGASVKAEKHLKKEVKKNGKWMMQPIKAPNGRTYTVMDDLVLAMINMGCKSFFILSCNPGHHSLSPEILKKPGVSIRCAENSALAENQYQFDPQVDPDDPYGEIENTLCEVETDLSAICESIGIDYLNDAVIDEAAKPAMELDTFLNEGVLANVWNALVKIIKSGIALLVKLFKYIVNLVRKGIANAKVFFNKIFRRKDGVKFQKPIRTGSILVEDAHVNSYPAKSWKDVQNALLRSCNAISRKIQQTETAQMKNMELMKTYSEHMSRTVQESANPLFDRIISLSIT